MNKLCKSILLQERMNKLISINFKGLSVFYVKAVQEKFINAGRLLQDWFMKVINEELEILFLAIC